MILYMGRKSFLFFSLILGFQSAFADEIVNDNDRKQIMSSIKDVEVTEILKKTSEYSECAEKYTYPEGAAQTQKDSALKLAQDCFNQKIQNTNDPKKLEELSNKLSLQQYGLVESNDVKEIRSYLTDKLYEALTGVNRKEKDQKKLIESMKFKNMKQVDQRVFFELHKAQLGQNALFEISRFCFEKLRVQAKENNLADNQFDTHWAGYQFQNTANNKIDVSSLTDSGKPEFDTFKGKDTSDQKEVYKAIAAGISDSGVGSLDQFFDNCGKSITSLCEEFTKTSSGKGAMACLTKSRIQDYKKAIAKTEEVLKDLDSYTDEEKERLKISLGEYKLYGSDPEDKRVDQLTRLTSEDIIGRSSNNKEIEDIENNCINGDEEACNQLAVSQESLEKIDKNISLQTAFKIEVEKKRIDELKKKPEDLKTYLRDNGYLDLLEKYEKNPNDPNLDISKQITAEFEARKKALQNELSAKLGKRQAGKDGKLINSTDANKQEIAKNAKEEKARMAQVVLFNNIISSFLTVTDDKKTQKGINVGVWRAESKEVQEDFFKNISTKHQGSEELKIKGASGMGFEVLDEYLK